MKTIKVYNFHYLGMILGVAVGLIVILVGAISLNWLVLVIGIIAFSFSLFQHVNNKNYRLVLDKEVFKEYKHAEESVIRFKNVESIDCKITLNNKTGSFYPIFHLVSNEGKKFTFKTQNQASLYEIALWLKENYPNAVFSDNANKVLSWAKSGTWLYKSH